MKCLNLIILLINHFPLAFQIFKRVPGLARLGRCAKPGGEPWRGGQLVPPVLPPQRQRTTGAAAAAQATDGAHSAGDVMMSN